MQLTHGSEKHYVYIYIFNYKEKERKNNKGKMVKTSNLENLGERYTRILCTVRISFL